MVWSVIGRDQVSEGGTGPSTLPLALPAAVKDGDEPAGNGRLFHPLNRAIRVDWRCRDIGDKNFSKNAAEHRLAGGRFFTPGESDYFRKVLARETLSGRLARSLTGLYWFLFLISEFLSNFHRLVRIRT